jgi:DNA repair photolyase
MLFEPNAPPISQRIKALEELHLAGIETYAMIAPMLPGAEDLAAVLNGMVDSVLVDRMNYHYSDWVYRRYDLERAMRDGFFASGATKLVYEFAQQNTECRVLF